MRRKFEKRLLVYRGVLPPVWCLHRIATHACGYGYGGLVQGAVGGGVGTPQTAVVCVDPAPGIW